jgi:hypothetical protein
MGKVGIKEWLAVALSRESHIRVAPDNDPENAGCLEGRRLAETAAGNVRTHSQVSGPLLGARPT